MPYAGDQFTVCTDRPTQGWERVFRTVIKMNGRKNERTYKMADQTTNVCREKEQGHSKLTEMERN